MTDLLLNLCIVACFTLAYSIRGGQFNGLIQPALGPGQKASNLIGRLLWGIIVGYSMRSPLAGFGAFAGISWIGHGFYFRMNIVPKPADDNKKDFLKPVVGWIKNGYWRCFTAMAIIGTARAGLVFGWSGDYWQILALGIGYPLFATAGALINPDRFQVIQDRITGTAYGLAVFAMPSIHWF